MGLFNLSKSNTSSVVKMVTERAPNFYAWNGKVYQSDIVRSCVRPAALLASKLEAKHIRETYKTGKCHGGHPEPTCGCCCRAERNDEHGEASGEDDAATGNKQQQPLRLSSATPQIPDADHSD